MSDERFAGVGTREYVALKLLEAVGQCEGKASHNNNTGGTSWDAETGKAWVLQTYAECLSVAYRNKPK